VPPRSVEAGELDVLGLVARRKCFERGWMLNDSIDSRSIDGLAEQSACRGVRRQHMPFRHDDCGLGKSLEERGVIVGRRHGADLGFHEAPRQSS
jgi:hypothetical protein